MKVSINSISKVPYSGFVYNMEVTPNHETADDQYYVDATNGLVVHNCHPRDNIALRWLAEEYDLGYDVFDTVMHAREIQAKNLAHYLVVQAQQHNLPIVIHGKAYKPDVPYCIGSYSTLVGFYVKEAGHRVAYVDPLADDPSEVVDSFDKPAVVLWAHNRKITYEYTGDQPDTQPYYDIVRGSVIVDPWRQLSRERLGTQGITVVHYGNTRIQK